MNKKQISIKQFFLLQAVVFIYTFANVFGKMASEYSVFSIGFIGFFFLELMVLGIYAILWQQMIKRVDLSIAYANRSIAILWSMLWAYLFFSEKISVTNILGVIIIVIGTVILNSDNE